MGFLLQKQTIISVFLRFSLESIAGMKNVRIFATEFIPPGGLIQRRGAICRCVPSVVAAMPCDAQNKGVPAKGTLLFF